MRTTLTLDDDIFEAVQHLARASGRRLGRVVSDLLRQGLKPAAAPRRQSRKTGFVFPVVEVPPGTPILTAAKVRKYLDDEGYF